ncbi:MAG TPA: DsbE family thiol:disulfide interchange protein [Xanthobacteraceae bacterium]|jgi:cytochrome c biogenesis protein CcmG/thiol:disulfide interchange protein DsbE
MRRWSLVVLPLAIFIALLALFWFRLGAGDASRLPSALIGKPAPALSLPPLEGLMRDGAPVPGLNPGAFVGRVTLVNVWASWCAPCRDEHPFLTRLSGDRRIMLVGINYKDQATNALRFLERFGNPYSAVGVDAGGRAAIEWGVYGVPETFLVGRDGRIAYKQIGPIADEATFKRVQTEIEKALGG